MRTHALPILGYQDDDVRGSRKGATVMAGTDTAVVRLSDLAHGQEAICFAALLKKERGTDKHGKPFLKCHFRDKRVTLVAPFWSGNALREVAESWADGLAYRLHVRGDRNIRYGMQIEVLDGRLAEEERRRRGLRLPRSGREQ